MRRKEKEYSNTAIITATNRISSYYIFIFKNIVDKRLSTP